MCQKIKGESNIDLVIFLWIMIILIGALPLIGVIAYTNKTHDSSVIECNKGP